MRNLIIFWTVLAILSACNKNESAPEFNSEKTNGTLYIIGGGKRTTDMIKEIAQLATLSDTAYGMVLTMASEEPDTAAFYAKKQFSDLGYKNIFSVVYDSINQINPSTIDSIKKASLIYISGGDQNKFMQKVLNTDVYQAIHIAYKTGATIAGTSAGAAVMSKRMITGNQLIDSTYTGEYRNIVSNNIEIGQGLGFLDSCIIDQHFIRRMRMNRLISVSIENPKFQCIGIDESTAIIVKNDSARVSGISQVIVLESINNKKVEQNLLGNQNMLLQVFLPGEKFKIK